MIVWGDGGWGCLGGVGSCYGGVGGGCVVWVLVGVFGVFGGGVGDVRVVVVLFESVIIYILRVSYIWMSVSECIWCWVCLR